MNEAFSQNLSLYIDRKGRRTLTVHIAEMSAFFCTLMPFDKAYVIAAQLYAGNTSRMDAASTVVVGGGLTAEHRSVSMTCKENTAFILCICCKSILNLFLFGIVLCGTGGIKDTEVFNRCPEIPHKKS